MNGLDRFKTEREVLNRFCKLTHQKAFIIHQKDQKFAQALKDVEYTEILGDDELVRDGKSEGMIMAILMAKLLGKDYIGFIDTDNFVPGSVWEYVKIYANGFSMTTTPYAMVRVLWIYKRHFHGRNKLFRKRGRVSSINNQFLNSLIGRITGFESDIIQTSCAGEHAMTLKLAETLPFASGYAVETYELAYIMERFGGIKPVLESEIATHGIEVSQIESRNPHVHELRGRESHIIREMLLPSLSSICYSPLCDQNLRERILKILISEGCLGSGERPPPPQIYPPVKNIDFERFAKVIEPQLSTYSALSRKKP
jgi:mannosyl-3-phosphoglycerate synthase